jgi:hypothetical protein
MAQKQLALIERYSQATFKDTRKRTAQAEVGDHLVGRGST